MDFPLLAALHAVPTLLMAGVIWTMQLVHYPLFGQVGTAGFPAWHAGHRARIAVLVQPLMLAELALNLLLCWRAETPATRLLAGAALALLALLWASTVLLQMPCHRRLARGFDAAVLRRLVATNWLRTAAASLRSAAAVALLLG